MGYVYPSISVLINELGNFKIENCRRSRRLNKNSKFELPSFNIDAARRAFNYRAPMLLNEAFDVLNVDISEQIPLNRFKLLLRSYYDEKI